MRIALALCLLLLAACGSLPDVLTPAPATSAPPAGSYWISIKDKFGLTPQEQERLFNSVGANLGTAKAGVGAPGAHELRITVTSYRLFEEGTHRSQGQLGDHVESVVQVVDLASGRVLSEERVLTRNRRAIGASSLLDEHGRDVVASLRGR